MLPLLRLRCQNFHKLRSCSPEHQHNPYAGRACFRCHPTLKDPYLPYTPMHLENSTHVATTCPDTADARNKALTKLAEVTTK